MSPQHEVVCPADAVFGMVRVTTAEGLPRTELRPGVASHGADGLPAPGLLFLLADSTVGGACVRILDANEVVVTSSLDIEIHSTPFASSDTVSGTGGAAFRYHGGAASAATLTSNANVVASVSGRFAVLELGARGGANVTASPVADAGSLPAAPLRPTRSAIDETLGANVTSADGDAMLLTFVASPDLANERQGLHGGCGALMGERACDALMRSVVPAHMHFEPVSMHADFFRPIAADGSIISCATRVVHAGSRLIAAQATLMTPAGRPAVLVDIVFAGVPS